VKHPHAMTEEEIVADLLANLPDEERDSLTKQERRELIGHHFGAGMHIRNHYGLWAKPMASRSLVAPSVAEVALDLESDEPLKYQDDYLRREEDPDEISMRIIVALWQKVRGE
jgi:hypothetical protein